MSIPQEQPALKLSEEHLEAGRNVEKLLKSKAIQSSQEFPISFGKEEGVTAGYISSNPSTNTTHIIKVGQKIPTTDKDIENTQDVVREYLMRSLYQRLLYDRAPKIGLVVDEKELAQNPKNKVVTLDATTSPASTIAIRSEFFKDFQTLREFSGVKDIKKLLDSKSPNLTTLEGFEKVMAACLLLGEIDYHGSNLGVVTNEDGKNIVVKIDHGRSGSKKYDSLESLIDSMRDKFKKFRYTNIPLDPKKLKESIDQMLQLNDNEIENFIRQPIAELKRANVHIPGNHCDKIEELFIQNIKQNKIILEELSEKLDIINTLDPQLGKNSKWIKEIDIANLSRPAGKISPDSGLASNSFQQKFVMESKMQVTTTQLTQMEALSPTQADYSSKRIKLEKKDTIKNTLRRGRQKSSKSKQFTKPILARGLKPKFTEQILKSQDSEKLLPKRITPNQMS